MQQCRVLVINDFAQKGGAEEVYRHSDRAIRGDAWRRLSNASTESSLWMRARLSDVPKSWNRAAAQCPRASLSKAFRPDRVLVHNYHNAPFRHRCFAVIARYKREFGLLRLFDVPRLSPRLLQPDVAVLHERTAPTR